MLAVISVCWKLQSGKVDSMGMSKMEGRTEQSKSKKVRKEESSRLFSVSSQSIHQGGTAGAIDGVLSNSDFIWAGQSSPSPGQSPEQSAGPAWQFRGSVSYPSYPLTS